MFTSKELYMMNGGNKLYIYKDGFGDVYTATPSEEAAWTQEVIDQSLIRIDTETDWVVFKSAIDNLRFHQYPDLAALLHSGMVSATPLRQLYFATALWIIARYEGSFNVLLSNLVMHRSECLSNVFICLSDFKSNSNARKFKLSCFQGNDGEVLAKANITLGMWAYSGIASLSKDNLLEKLNPRNRNEETFEHAVQQLKQILEAS